MGSTRQGLDRRTMLRVVGGVAAAGATGLLWRAHDQRLVGTGASVALEPWRAWRGDDAVGALALVHAAVLAASPHNTQPWLFEVAPDRIDLFADEARNLGAIDPDRRELQIGLGCALENLALAAAPHGFLAELRLGEQMRGGAPVASIALAAAPRTSSPLFEAIPRRHTDRGPYRRDSPPAAFLDEIERLAGDLPDARLVWWRSESDRRHFARETVAASAAIVADQEQAQASARWIRFDADQIERHRDGLGVDSLGLSPFVSTLLKLAPTPNRKRIDEGWLKATEEVHTATAPLFGAIVVRDDRRLADRLQAGRLWQRLQLAATIEGISGQPLSQLVERRDREVELGLPPHFADALRTMVGSTDWHAVLPFRLGSSLRAALPSPRRAASDVLI